MAKKPKQQRDELTDSDRYVLERIIVGRLNYGAGNEPDWAEMTKSMDWESWGGRPGKARVYRWDRKAAVARIYWRLRAVLDKEVKKIT